MDRIGVIKTSLPYVKDCTKRARTLHALNREPLLEALIMFASFSLFEGGNRENTIAVVG